MFINLSHFLASTLLWVFFGMVPNPRYENYFRSVGAQNPSHQLFWNFMTTFIGFMTIQASFEARLRCAYQNLQQLQMLASLFNDIDMSNYIDDLGMIIAILHHFIQRFGPIAQHYDGSPVEV